jgi:uncharacterized protein (DUF952 family)
MIYHVTPAADWQHAVAVGQYTPAAFAYDGFIHCCHDHQLVAVGNRYYRGHSNLVVLCIDTTRLRPQVKHEPATGREELFPHIYGSLHCDAVVGVVPFPAQPDGTFALPRDLIKDRIEPTL